MRTATTESVLYALRRKAHCVLESERKTSTAYPINVMGKHISSPPQYGRRDPRGVPQRLRERCCLAHDVPLIRSLRAPAPPSASVLFSLALSLDCGGIIRHPAIKNDFKEHRGARKVAILLRNCCGNGLKALFPLAARTGVEPVYQP